MSHRKHTKATPRALRPKPVEYLARFKTQELEDLLSGLGLGIEAAETKHADSPKFRKALKRLDSKLRKLAGYGGKP